MILQVTPRNSRLLVLLLIGLCPFNSGCVGMLANVMYAANGQLVPARFKGCQGRRVAVVCVSDSPAFGPSSASRDLARRITGLLSENVTEIQLVESQAIADWIDENDWDYMDYQALGRGVDAELVVAVDLDSFSLHEGKTMYKGRADVRLVVYDMTQNGKTVFTHEPPQIQYPRNTGHHTADMSERQFRRRFLDVLARHIARNFYPYDAKEDYAQDTSLIGA